MEAAYSELDVTEDGSREPAAHGAYRTLALMTRHAVKSTECQNNIQLPLNCDHGRSLNAGQYRKAITTASAALVRIVPVQMHRVPSA
jgi:hypothetical protein